MSAQSDRAIRKGLQNIINDIFTSQKQLGIYDSGTAERSTFVRSRGKQLQVVAPAYLETNFDGQGMKPQAIGSDMIRGLLSWTKLSTIVGQNRLQAAFAVARNLVAFGSAIYNGRAGIPIDEIVRKNGDKMQDELGDVVTAEALDIIDNMKLIK